MPLSKRTTSFSAIIIEKMVAELKYVAFKNSTAASFISARFYYYFILLLFTVDSVGGYVDRTMKSYRTF